MSPARRLALRLSRISFRFLLVIVVTAWAFLLTFYGSQQIKQSLENTQAHDRFVPALIEATVKQSDEQTPFSDPLVQKLVLSSFTPQIMQSASSSVIDGWYSWLRGEVSEPAFIVDFRPQREQLAQQLSVYAVERLSSLPVCTTFDIASTLDPFTASCQPPGIDYQTEQQSLFAELLTSDEFLPDVLFTQADLPKTANGGTIAQTYSYIPFTYGMAWPITIVLTLLLVLVSITILMLRPVVRSGWRELGRMLITNGVVLAVSGLVFGLLIPRLSRTAQGQFVTGGSERLVGDVFQDLSVAFQSVFINISLFAAVIGLLIIVGLRAFPQRSRYEGLEKVTGITNGIRPKYAPATAQKAAAAPIVTSERRRTQHKPGTTKRHKSPASKEVA